MLADLGLTVARHIPIEALGGLVTGGYTLHGGVVRDAAGRIVSHLVSAGAPSALASLVPGGGILMSLLEQGQLWGISRDIGRLQTTVNTVLDVSIAGAVTSGLGLVTSIAGVAYLSKRFTQVDKKLAELEKGIKDIKGWLESLQKAKLQFAIDCIRHAETATDRGLRRDMLLQGKKEFSTLAHHYREQWSRCKTLHEIQAVDDLYTLALMGSALVCSDLGLGEEAAQDLRANSLAWSTQARLHAKALLFEDRPFQLLGADNVDILPSRKLVELLDFAHDTNRGIDWLDQLRSDYGKSTGVLDKITPPVFGRSQRPGGKGGPSEIVNAASLLCARRQVLDANVAHYEFLEAKRVGATDFQKQLDAALKASGGDAICVHAFAPAEAPSA